MIRLLPYILGVLLLVQAVGVVLLGDLSHATARFLTLFGGMFAVYVAAVVLIRRIDLGRRWLFVAVVAVLMRGVFCVSPPSLSADVYRYLWEGRVIAAGSNPFLIPPQSDALAHLRDDNFERIDHRHLATIYPPAAQAVFWVGVVVWPSVTMQKILFVLFDLGTMLLLYALLRRRGRDPGYVVIYAWSPLVALEVAHSGHMDSIAIFGLMLAIFMFERQRPLPGMFALAASALAKFLALALLPFFVMKKRYRWGIGVVVAVVALGYVPFASAGPHLFASLREYGTYWYFNSVAFGMLAKVFANTDAIRLALLAAVGIFAWYQAWRQADLLRYVFLVIGFALLMTPTVYPWYIVWIVPFLCFYPSIGWIAFTGLVVASYAVWPHYRESGEWVVRAPLLATQYVPFFALLALDAWRHWRARRAGCAA